MSYKNILIFVFSFVFFITIYLGSAEYIINNSDFHLREFSKLGVYEKVPNADNINSNIISFFNDKNNLSYFNEKEASHLYDVKKLINGSNIISIIFSVTSIILFSLILSDSKNLKKELSKIFIFSSTLIILFPLMCLFFDFSSLFLKFHGIFFPQGNFLFPADSLLIQLYPGQFFYDCFIQILINPIILAAFLIVLSMILSRKQ